MTLKPLGKRVLLKITAAETKTNSGLYIPETAQEKMQTGTVVAIGESEEITVKPGDKVMFDKYAGTSVKVDGEDHLIIEIKEVLAVVA